MKSADAFAGFLALCWPATGLAQPPEPPRTQPPPIHSIVFRCRVAEGPKLTACEPADPTTLDPRAVANLKQIEESTPRCMLPPLEVGSVINRRLDYAEGPWLLAPPRPGGHVITNPNWAERPTPDVVARFYPAQARAAHTGGHVTLACVVNADGTTRDCRVTQEEPTDLGFGDAALQMSREFRMKPKTLDCVPTSDGKINIPLSFPPM